MRRPAVYPEPYIAYLAEYHGSRDYFECHELMEEYWKSQRGGRYDACWLALIRLAVGCYHARRGNWSGAVKMLAKAQEDIDPRLMDELGLDGDRLARLTAERRREWSADPQPQYRPLELPIADESLRESCIAACVRRGWTWLAPDDGADPELVHRHSRRDRTDVIDARARSALNKARRADG